MQFLTDLWAAITGVFRRQPAPEPDPGASATLELSRTDIEIIDPG